MTTISVRDASLFVKVMGHGYPLLLMHGGPGLDHTTLLPFRCLADQFTLVFYDHRCNGRSNGVDVSSMTWENLTADADALREMLGYERWAVLGHSFGGNVALEYALRYPQRLSHLVLLDTGGDARWPRQNAAELLARRGFSPDTVETVRRFFNGQIEPYEMVPSVRKFAGAYYHHLSLWQLPHELVMGLRMKARPEALVFANRQLLNGWTVTDRLGEIEAPTLVMAGRDDFLYPPEHQEALAAAIPNARLEIIERAGHNPHSERSAEVVEKVRTFLSPATAPAVAASGDGAYAAIDNYVQNEMRRLKLPGVSMAIVEGNRIIHLRGFGRARPGGGTPAPQTPFFIGSINKSIIALSVMQLAEAGKLELDAPLQRYLPWFRVADPTASSQITLRHLLTQSSGLPNSAGEIPLADYDNSPGASQRQARALATVALSRPPGAAFEYSNANYHLLALVVEAVSGESFAAFAQKRIFAPLEMNHTYTWHDAAKQNGLAMGHRYWFGMPVAAPNLPLPYGSFRDTLIISTAEDIAHYLIAHLNGGCYGDARILSGAGIEEMHRAAVDFGAAGLGPLERLLAGGVSFGQYGMGWSIDHIDGTKVVWHGGTLPDFEAFVFLLPEQKKGLVLLFNACHHMMHPALIESALGAAAILAGKQPLSMAGLHLIPWLLRALMLLPPLQLAGAAATLLQLRRWRLDGERRPRGGRAFVLHFLLPLVSNLLFARGLLRPQLGKRRGYLRLYMPDVSWVAIISGGFAALWGVLRSAMVLRALRRSLRQFKKRGCCHE